MGDKLDLICNGLGWTQEVAWKTNRKRWTIETNSERGFGKSVLVAQHDDDNDFMGGGNARLPSWSKSVWSPVKQLIVLFINRSRYCRSVSLECSIFYYFSPRDVDKVRLWQFKHASIISWQTRALADPLALSDNFRFSILSHSSSLSKRRVCKAETQPLETLTYKLLYAPGYQGLEVVMLSGTKTFIQTYYSWSEKKNRTKVNSKILLP